MSASLTSLVKNTIKAYVYESDSPASIMARTNDVVSRALTTAVFITIFFGIFDTLTRRFIYCSAGYPPALRKRSTSETSFLATSSPMIGAFTGVQ